MIRDGKHIDELIEGRVNKNIEDFAKDITNQIQKYIIDNGEDRHRADRFFQVSEWKDGFPTTYSPMSIERYRVGLQFSIAKIVKDKMIERDTKFLLNKINSML